MVAAIISNPFARLSLRAALDILIIAALIYYMLKLLRGTRAMQMLIAILLLIILYEGARRAQFEMVEWLLNTLLPYVAIALIVGTVVAGQTFYIFTIENLKQFGALKAIGTSNGRLVGMILLQASVVGLIGYAIGMGLTAGFFSVTSHRDATRGIVMLWQVMAGSGAVVMFIVLVASLLSIRRVLVLEPAIVFRG